jgi:hypothetical protein
MAQERGKGDRNDTLQPPRRAERGLASRVGTLMETSNTGNVAAALMLSSVYH